MNTSEKSAGRGSGRKRLGVTSLVLTVAILLSACAPGGGSPPPKDDGDDRKAAPPGHFVLSITPGTGPNPTVTFTIPHPTQVPPTVTRPPLTGTVVPTSIPIDPTIPHPTIWDPPPVEEDPAGDDGVVETIPNHTIPKTTIPDDTIPETTIPETTIPRTTVPDDDRLKAKRVVLACNPDAGTHPDPGAACTSLRNVNGYFEKLPADPAGICPDIYAPVWVEAIGYWGTRRVKYKETFSNACVAAASTDHVFRF